MKPGRLPRPVFLPGEADSRPGRRRHPAGDGRQLAQPRQVREMIGSRMGSIAPEGQGGPPKAAKPPKAEPVLAETLGSLDTLGAVHRSSSAGPALEASVSPFDRRPAGAAAGSSTGRVVILPGSRANASTACATQAASACGQAIVTACPARPVP